MGLSLQNLVTMSLGGSGTSRLAAIQELQRMIKIIAAYDQVRKGLIETEKPYAVKLNTESGIEAMITALICGDIDLQAAEAALEMACDKDINSGTRLFHWIRKGEPQTE
jgi:hypothetical protein